MAKLALYLSSLNPSNLLALLISVINGLTGNANFTAPAVTLAILTSLRDRLQNTIDAARTGGKQQKLERDDVVREVQAALKKEADYVTLICEGDATKLNSSGFNLARPLEPVVQVAIPRKFTVRTAVDVEGVLDLRWSGSRGVHGFELWMTATDPNVAANWENIGFTTRSRFSADGLESGKKYWFAVEAVGANSVSAKCAPAYGRAA